MNASYKILIRYLILLMIVIFGLPIIYAIFSPLTINFTISILDIFYSVANFKELIVINETTQIYIVDACIAGSAYLLLLILNLTIPLKKEIRIKSILYTFLLLFFLNIIRIVILASLYHNNVAYVEFTHAIFWYGLSTIFVVLIWFQTTRRFKIKEIPLYTDYRALG